MTNKNRNGKIWVSTLVFAVFMVGYPIFSAIREDRISKRIIAAQAISDRNVYLSLLKISGEARIIADRSGTILIATPKAAEAIGYTSSELIGKSIDMLMPDRFKALHDKAYRARFARPNDRISDVECDGLKKDGSEVHLSIRAMVVDSPLGLVAVVTILDTSRIEKIDISRGAKR